MGDASSDLSTFFPTFAVGSTFLETAGFLTWHGLWDLGTTGVGLEGYQGGVEGGVPLVLFDRDSGADAMVLSPASNFKVGTQTLLRNGTVLGCGLQGQLDSVPVGFQHDTLLVASPRGINATGMLPLCLFFLFVVELPRSSCSSSFFPHATTRGCVQ